tara:strand:+ start:5854 stop:6201 length:348 start_codon:yes stop_codon:yes gene_type:complete
MKRKVKKRVVKKSDNPMYMRVENPKALEKRILGSAISTVNLLKRFDNFAEIRKKKVVSLGELRKSVNGIQKEVSSFKRGLPKVSDEDVVEAKVDVSNLGSIDKELIEIESRLKDL